MGRSSDSCPLDLDVPDRGNRVMGYRITGPTRIVTGTRLAGGQNEFVNVTSTNTTGEEQILVVEVGCAPTST